MGQEDYLKRQIDQLGKVLGKLLADLIGLGPKGQTTERIARTNHVFKKELNLDIEKLMVIPPDKMVDRLKETKKLSFDHLDKIADIFFLLAESCDEKDIYREKRKYFYQLSGLIYEHLNKNDKTYSLERQFKLGKIKKVLVRYE